LRLFALLVIRSSVLFGTVAVIMRLTAQRTSATDEVRCQHSTGGLCRPSL
jgi:hypothetical protein